jgi:DMSO/TMAO reductase YedYZ molybdopterin-dependent catalytic subunit
MSSRFRAGIAGVAGAVVAFGIAELVHGLLYESVPSVFVSLAQRVVELTPGELVTRGIELLGMADIPVLITSMVIGALVLAAFLANLSLRHPLVALAAVGFLGAVAVVATFAEPFVAPAPTVVTIAGALGSGCAVTGLLLSAAGLRAQRRSIPPPPPPPPEAAPPARSSDARSPVVRSREAHTTEEGTIVAVNRRNFLVLGASALAAGLAAVGAGRVLAGRGGQVVASAPPEPLKLPKEGSLLKHHKTLPPPPEEASIEAPGMPALITPASSFYLIDTALASPRIDLKRWKLSVKGAVDNPIELTYNDLLDMPTREADITLSCVSNVVGGGLISNGRWTGVLLSEVLAEAGMSPEKITRSSAQIVGRSVDGWTSGFRTELALDGREALIAFGLNGSELPLKHGYPVRLVIPGLYGYVSATKWLTEIELTDWDFDAYWIQRTWAKEGPIKTQSRIDTLKSGEQLSAGKKIAVGGVAWAPHRGIEGVEVSTDGGESWNEARLASQLDTDTWRQYVYDWEAAKPGEYTLKVRATDGEGQTQTADKAPPHPSGATGYHTISVTVA